MRYLARLSCLLLMVVFLAACAPPPRPGSPGYQPPRDDGRLVLPVEPKTRPAFRTVMIDGAERLEARGDVGRFGGTFRDVVIGEAPKTFSPWVSTDATSSMLGGMLFAGLVTTDAYTGETVPYLAKSVDIQPDQQTYVVTLRKGLTWSDGQPLTADDVVFTWNDIIRPGFGNASLKSIVTIDGQFPRVRKLDNLTVEFKTAKPFAPFHAFLGIAIAPRHVLKPVVAQGNEVFSAFWGAQDAEKRPQSFVGNGMWVLEKYETRNRAIFKRNPHFFMVDKQGRRLPYLDRYVISFVGDMNNQALQFEQGRADYYEVPAMYVSHVRQLKQPGFQIFNLGPTTSTTFLSFNLNPRRDKNGKPWVDPVKSRWFNDVNFRQAVNHAIVREDLVANILKGVGQPLFTPESPTSVFLNPKLSKGFSADPDYSRSLLKKSGFTWNAQGQLLDPQGHPVRFTLLTNSNNTQRVDAGVNIKQDLETLGMVVDFKPVEFNVLVDKLREGSYETVLMGLTGSQLEPHGGANVWKSDGFLHMFNQRVIEPGKPVDLSDQLPWEAELDRMFEQGAQVIDLEKRKPFYHRYQEIVYEQAPFVYLFSPLHIVAVRDRIRNLDPTPLGIFHNMEEIWIDDAKDSVPEKK